MKLSSEVLEVGDGVFAYVQHDGTWWINTAGFVVGDDAVTVVDSCATRPRAEALRSAVGAVSSAPIRTLVNTHAHGDHTYGNEVFDPATIVGHEGCRRSMLKDPVRWSTAREEWWAPAPEWTDLELRPPTVTLTAPATIWNGERPVELRPTGAVAHTDHDLIVVLDDVAFVGDLLFSGGTPLFLSGSLTGYLEVTEQLRALSPRLLVAGHGVPCGLEEVEAHVRYVRMVLDAAREGIAEDRAPLEVARSLDLGEFAERPDAERIVLNLHRAYTDLDPRRPFDLPGAFTDALTFHGGPLTTHV